MWPLLFASVLSFALMIERTIAFGRYRRFNSGSVALDEALAEFGGSQNKEAIEAVLSAAGSRSLRRLSRGLDLLELIGRISPMLGLLGTVLGLTKTFRTVSAAVGGVDPALLAGGIWEALITTVAGLGVAIPALVALHIFSRLLAAERGELKAGAEERVARLLLASDHEGSRAENS